MAIRLSGMASGLDTDSIVQALVSSYSYKKSKYEKAQTKLGWTQEAWKSLNTKVYSLYSNVSNLRFSTAYSLKKTSVSDSTKASVKAGSSAPNGTQTLKITNTAKAGYLTGEQINASSSSTTLAQLGYTGGDAKINVNTKDGTKSITLSATSTMSDVEKQLKEAGLNASYDSTYKRFYISAKDTGADNDFTLTGANTGGATALYKLGIAVGTSTSNPYSQYDSLYGGSDAATQQKIENAVAAYKSSSSNIEKYTAQSNNLLNAITYGTAYADVKDFYSSLSGTKTESGADIDTAKLETLAKLGSGRDSAIITKNSDGTYTTYSKTTAKDADGNTVYKSEDGKYISAEERYTNGGKTYKKNSDGTYVNVSDENDKYSGDTADLTKTVTYKKVSESKSYVSGSDADTKTYTKNSDDTYTCDGKTYTKRDDGKYYAEGEAADSKNGVTITEKVEYTSSTEIRDAEAAADAYKDITKNIDEKALSTYSSNLSTVTAFESTKDTSLTSSDKYTIAGLTSDIHDAYNKGGKDAVSNLIAGNGTDSDAYAAKVAALTTSISSEQTKLDANKLVKELAAIKDTTSSEYQTALKNMVETVNSAHDLSSNAQYNTKAKKVDGEDAEIWLNGVQYTGSSSTFTINNLTIDALDTTGNDEISITTSTDTQGIYDKVKDFLTEYNNIINEMTKLYNASSSKGYEPLTDDEKDSMSDKEIEKWETKIKDSLLRNDSTLNGVMSAMTSAMSQAVEIDGKKYSLSSFGIHTLGYLNAADNEQNAYHIDGDEDDTNTSGNADKLMKAISEDPDTIMQFMQKVATNLYTAIGDKMKATSLSSSFTIYNDKQMTTQYSDYTKLIKEWETKISDKEDYYYKKFSSMESALTKLNSTQSSLSGYFS
ncbi:flagellar filament capping protein FliD [Agathobacter sp.]|uniref:flagellar filament capping protein FliD n=1 Tax=Agathobacter sp. TaxID=2021311 RepID=UPI003AB1A89A